MSIPYTQVMKGTMGLQPFSAEWRFTSPLKEEGINHVNRDDPA